MLGEPAEATDPGSVHQVSDFQETELFLTEYGEDELLGKTGMHHPSDLCRPRQFKLCGSRACFLREWFRLSEGCFQCLHQIKTL